MPDTTVQHSESWFVRIECAVGDEGWPEKERVRGTLTRWLAPDTITFTIRLGEEDPIAILVHGDKIGQAGRVASKFPYSRLPEWAAVIIEHERQANDLGRGRTCPEGTPGQTGPEHQEKDVNNGN
jgi:hypothetical protein